MTDLQNHIAAVAANPFDKTAALTLADHFQEAAGYSRWTALRKVVAVRRPGMDAMFLARAARVMRSQSSAKPILNARIEEEAELGGYDLYRVYLIRGFSAPSVTTTTYHPEEYPETEADVSVGSRWVLSCYRRCQKQAAADRFARKYLGKK